jgi:hypothetical protein
LANESATNSPPPRSIYVRSRINNAKEIIKEFERQRDSEKNFITY